MNFLILSHHRPTFNKDLALWWAPRSLGYTIDVDKAGRYGKREAEAICKHGEATMVPVPEAKRWTRQVVIFGDIPHQTRPERQK